MKRDSEGTADRRQRREVREAWCGVRGPSSGSVGRREANREGQVSLAKKQRLCHEGRQSHRVTFTRGLLDQNKGP